MKVVILCGGKGERLGEISSVIPKPMIPIGGRPVLWHIMKIFSHYGFNDFILCLGYKGEQISEYFRNSNYGWNIKFVNTGVDSKKSERLKLVKNDVGEDFFLCYGDDLSDVDVREVLKAHKDGGKIVTLTAVRLSSPFGMIEMKENGTVTKFSEKPVIDHWINGGFMAVNKKIFDHLDAGELEQDVFGKIAKEGMIGAYKHHGTWKSMTTLKDNAELDRLWTSGNAFWKKWDD